METHHAGNVRAAARQFQHGRPAETVANRRDPLLVDALVLLQQVKRRLHPRPQQRAIRLVLARLLAGLLGILRAHILAVDVGGERDVAHPGQFLRAPLHKRADSHPIVDHQHTRPLRLAGIVGEVAFECGVALLIFDDVRLYQGLRIHAEPQRQNNRCRFQRCG